MFIRPIYIRLLLLTLAVSLFLPALAEAAPKHHKHRRHHHRSTAAHRTTTPSH